MPILTEVVEGAVEETQTASEWLNSNQGVVIVIVAAAFLVFGALALALGKRKKGRK